MRVIVTGSMSWTDEEAVRRELTRLPAGSVVVHGDASGVDEIAGWVARQLGLAVERYAKDEDDYRRYGKGAWKGLNERMLAAGAALVLAFHPELGVPGKARGSGHLIRLAEEKGVEVRKFTGAAAEAAPVPTEEP
jgi:hypothetical protein